MRLVPSAMACKNVFILLLEEIWRTTRVKATKLCENSGRNYSPRPLVQRNQLRIFSWFTILGYVLQIRGTSIVPLTPHITSDTSFSRKLRGASGYIIYIYTYIKYRDIHMYLYLFKRNTFLSQKKYMTGFTHNCLAGLVGSVLFPRGAFLHRRGLSFSGAADSWRDLKVEFLWPKRQP